MSSPDRIRNGSLVVLIRAAAACGQDGTSEPEPESPILAHTVLGTIHGPGGTPRSGALVRATTHVGSCGVGLDWMSSDPVTTNADGAFALIALLGDYFSDMRGCIRLLVTPPAHAVMDTVDIPDARFRLLLTEPRDTTRIEIVLPDAGSGP